MGIFSNPKLPKSSSTWKSAGEATLGGVRVSLTLLEKLMDGTSVPFVKGVVGTALEVIKIAKDIQSDREDCDILIKQTTSLLIVILDTVKGKTEKEIPDYLKRGVDKLSASFQEILDDLRIIEKRTGKRSAVGIAKSILYHFDNSEKLKGCSTRLDWAITEFQVTSKVESCLKDLERHEELRKELQENRTAILEGQGAIKEGQTKLQVDLQSGHEKIQDGQARIQEYLAEIRDAVKEKIGGNAPSNLPSTVMPANPRIFGRQSYIDKAVKLLLSTGSTRLAILGPGGMGKTSVALKIVHNSKVIARFKNNRRWVPCEQATSMPLFIELLAKSLGLPPSTSNDRFGEIVDALEESDALQFILFDNFETIWDIEEDQSTVADILSRLASISSVSFILTMRGIQHPASDLVDWTSPRLPPLTPLEMEPAQDAFVKISPDSEGDPHLPELLRELDCMPLAITLMAKLAEVGETVQELLSQWRQEQVKLLSRPDGDRRSSIEVSIRLSLMSSSVRTNTDAIALLSVLARLPGGASLTQLSTICPSISGWKAALRVLRTAALVYDSPDKTVVQMLSPIRSYILLHHPLEKGPLQDLRAAYYALADKGKAYHGDSDLDDVMTELQKEETNLDAIIIDALSNAGDKEDALVAALAYSNYLSLTQPRVNVIVAAIRAARDTGSTQLPDCLQSYGDTLRFQSQYDAALIALEEARDKFTLLGDSSSAAYCLWSIADALRVRSRYDEACSVLEKAMRHFNDLNDPVGASECLCNLGAIYEEQGNFELARSTLEEARSQLVEQGADLGIANCLRALGRVYRAQGEYEAALSIAEEAKFAHIELHDQLGTAHTLKLFSDIYYDQGRYSEAYSAADEARSAYVKLGDKLATAFCIMSICDILLKQGRYDEARPLVEEAEDACQKLADDEGIANSRRLLGDIYRMQGDYDKAYSLLEEAKSLFGKHHDGFSSSLGIADCDISLGKILRLQGRYDKAIELLEEARAIFSTQNSKKSDAAECNEEIESALKAQSNCGQS